MDLAVVMAEAGLAVDLAAVTAVAGLKVDLVRAVTASDSLPLMSLDHICSSCQ